MISSFMTPSVNANYTYPASLKEELSRKGLLYRPALRETHRSGNVGRFLEEVALSTRERVESVLFLMQEKEWDLFCFVFLSPDLLQHELWHILDSRHPKHRSRDAEVYEGAICDFYTQLGDHISQIVKAAGEDTLVILMSDHGFGPVTHFFHVNNWLTREGFLVRQRNIRSAVKYLLFRLGFTPINTFRALTSLRLGWLRQYVRFGRGFEQARRVYFSFNDIDWSKTKAFSVGNWGQIYFNWRGRRPNGIVEPGRESENLRDTMIDGLLDLRDPDTGERIVQRVMKGEELYSGACQGLGPDLIPLTKGLEYVSFGTSDFGSNQVIEPVHGMSGHHRLNGMLMMRGKDIRRGSTLTGAEIVDLAPTILYAMGVPIPIDMDGKVLTEAFAPAFTAANVPTFSDTPSVKEAFQESYSEQDAERVRERLRGMGYMA
jgi:predicted AlkP superfamily phosphohydrolase/phosphomutase